MKLGCHVSIKDGYLGAAKRAYSLGANAFQYFPKNPRSLGVKSFDRHDAKQCAEFCAAEQMVSIAHTPYPTNIAATGEKETAVVESLLNDLDIADACGSFGIVVHFGSAKGDLLQGYQQMLNVLNQVQAQWEGRSLILIENMAGKGDQLGMTMEELIKIRELTNYPEKIGFCLDTCHAFASDLWNGRNWNAFVDKGRELGFIEQVKAIHFNNSFYPNGSRKDRHSPIVKGEIHAEAMKEILLHAEFADVPFILETPNTEKDSHQQEIEWMKQVAGN
ncbi:deoxyribonuclease IV [Pullulanibacillus sp. KACC 23026]|uniref:deoxyribonuclease IV n=1 Tax=Pullulanibacillus sp. KACC 23026 TaxID=3028315 RepID=UPI0023AED65A|nr:deoxyribonuclease IV [Pullulanibacillus sp. KACC 23026]WEG10840.1 deoxyribonuclease IV [Pullulanibacillus sp. KACC 23026]